MVKTEAWISSNHHKLPTARLLTVNNNRLAASINILRRHKLYLIRPSEKRLNIFRHKQACFHQTLNKLFSIIPTLTARLIRRQAAYKIVEADRRTGQVHHLVQLFS
ncbi:MAG TPA: hypothetical protein VF624_19485 [Tepidisphaeraceae bacterium]